MDEAEMYPICDQCHHAMSMHIGPVDMGRGHVEPLGCTHSIGPDEVCDCLNYDKEGEW